jgi:hypothetical protein
MQSLFTPLLGCLLVWTISTAMSAQMVPPKPVAARPNLERQMKRLEQLVDKLQVRVEALEHSVYESEVICPCFDKDDLIRFSLQNCVITPNGTVFGEGKQATVTLGGYFCQLNTPDASLSLPITRQEYMTCLQPFLAKAATETLRCPTP